MIAAHDRPLGLGDPGGPVLVDPVDGLQPKVVLLRIRGDPRESVEARLRPVRYKCKRFILSVLFPTNMEELY